MARTTTLAVLGDVHFGREDPPVVKALVDELRTLPPDATVVAGDLTQRARRAEFQAARAFIDALPGPVLAIPGNHDLPLFDIVRRMARPYSRYLRYIAPELEPTLPMPAVTVLGVDATRRLRHKDGQLDAGQIERVAARIQAAGTPFRVVVVHQPLAAAEAEDEHNVAHGGAAAIAAWTRAGADLFVGGHVHKAYTLQVGDARTALVAQTGTAVSNRRRGTPNSYYRISLVDDGGTPLEIRLLRRDFDDATRCFRTHGEAIARKDDFGWRL